MSAVYPYSLASDFPNGISEQFLARQIIDADLGQVLENIKCVGDDVSIVFEAAIVSESALDALVAAHNPIGYSFGENYLEEEFTSSKLVRRTWFAYKQSSVYMYKVDEWLFTYDATGVYLDQEQFSSYDPLGNVTETHTWNYFTVVNGSTTTIRKEEV
jgi:hypothetical protein